MRIQDIPQTVSQKVESENGHEYGDSGEYKNDCGAYCLPLASNYNASLRPAVVLVREGKARLIRRRETFSDLTRHDIV